MARCADGAGRVSVSFGDVFKSTFDGWLNSGRSANPFERSWRLNAIRRQVAGDTSMPFGRDAAASLVGMKPGEFSRWFKYMVGASYTEWQRFVRIAKSLDLLASDETPIAQIAAEVGYGELSTFYRNFRAVTGTTPKEVRRSILEQPCSLAAAPCGRTADSLTPNLSDCQRSARNAKTFGS